MTKFTTILQALGMREGLKPWEPGAIALDHEGKPTLWYRGNSSKEWAVDARKDEDPRHIWCEGSRRWSKARPEWGLRSVPFVDCSHLLAHCHRCDHTYLELLHAWQEEQTPGWAYGDKNWSEVDPKGRTLEQGRHDFESSLCEGERRNAAGRWLP